MPIAKPGVWDEDNVERLKTLLPTHTASQIAAVLASHGSYFSRNAVIGKAHRLGLAQGSQSWKSRAETAAPVTRVARPKARRPQAAPPKPTPDPVVPTFVPRLVDTGPRHLTLLQLDDTTCKFECSGAADPSDFTFCGHLVEKSGPYCAAHARRCYDQPRRPYKPQRRAA